jgi:hypothetical protein
MSNAKLSYDSIQEAYLMKKVVIIIVSAETGFEDYRFNLPLNFVFKPQMSHLSVWHREDKSVDPLNSSVCLPSITSQVLYKDLKEEIY